MPQGVGYGIGVGAAHRAKFEAKTNQVGNAPQGPEVNSGQPVAAGQLPHVTPVADRISLSDEVKQGRNDFKSGSTKAPLTYGSDGRGRVGV